MKSRTPGYWRNETSGILQPAVERYFSGEELLPEDIGAIRVYLRQWIILGDFLGVAIQSLRAEVDWIGSRSDIARWTAAAIAAGVDPW